MQLQFKPFEIEDVSTVMQMMEQFYAIDGYPMDVTVSEKLFQEFVGNENLGKGWIIFHEQKPVGYVILTFVFSFEYAGSIAFLDELFVVEEMRGKQIGKQAIDFVSEIAKKLGVKIIYLEIEPHNEAAKKLYLSKNYTEHKRGLMRLKL